MHFYCWSARIVQRGVHWHRWIRTAGALVVLLTLFGNGAGGIAGAGGGAPPPPRQPAALVLVPLAEPERLNEAVSAGLVPYRQLDGPQGSYLLAGRPAGLALPFDVRTLDSPVLPEAPRRLRGTPHGPGDISGAAYYLVYPAPDRARPRWADYGQLLLDEGFRVLLRTTEADAQRLTEQGAHLVYISLEPLALESLRPPEVAAPVIVTADSTIRGMINKVNSETVYTYTAQLSGEVPVTVGGQPYTILTRYHYSGVPIQKATQYIGEHLAALGYTVEYQSWSDATNPNVIGERTGRSNPEEIFLIGGHLDDMPGSGAAPGADDNASGSVGALVMADIASQYEWGCTLRFAFWTGEELGLLGSNAYAARARDRGENIRGYLNLDMISHNSDSPRALNLFVRNNVPGSEEIADLFVNVVGAYGLNLVPVKYVNDALGERSDNGSFWTQGYPAILAIEDYYGNDFNPNYHTPDDRLAQVDLDYYTEFVKAAVGTFAHMTGCLIESTRVAYLPLVAE